MLSLMNASIIKVEHINIKTINTNTKHKYKYAIIENNNKNYSIRIFPTFFLHFPYQFHPLF